MKRVTQTLLITIAMMISGATFAGGHDGSGGGAKGQPGDGHCTYTQENMFAGPFAVCEHPANAAGCEELGSTDDNADAAHGEGECPTENLVGTCDRGDSQLLYYEGDPGGLEIGCGFQGGEWVAP